MSDMFFITTGLLFMPIFGIVAVRALGHDPRPRRPGRNRRGPAGVY